MGKSNSKPQDERSSSWGSRGENNMLAFRISLVIIAAACAALWMVTPGASASQEATAKAKAFIDAFTAKIRPLDTAANYAWWEAMMTGNKEAFKKKEDAQNQLDTLLSDKAQFAELKAIKEAGKIDNPVTKRAIDVIYLMLLEKQLDAGLLKDMNKLSNEIEEIFTNFRAKLTDSDGSVKTLDDNQVRDILKQSTLSEKRKATWEAAKKLGAEVEPGLKRLVKLRNEAAVKLGFKNYHAMQLHLREQNGEELIKLFDRLDELMREPFKKAKAEIDVELAKNCNIKVAELMPWHYHDQFFQEVPAVFKTNIDKI